MARQLQPIPDMRRIGSKSNLVARLGTTSRGIATERRTGRVDTVYLLALDVAQLPPSGRRLLELAERERESWLVEANRCTASAIVLITDESVEFYTGDQDHLQAIRPQVTRFTEQTRDMPEFRSARVIEQTGPRALRRLMNFASGLWTDARGAHRAAVELQRAATLAQAQHTLCPTLAALFQTAVLVGERVAHESELHDSRLGDGARDLEIPTVERIIEEELAEFKVRAQSIPAATRGWAALEASLACGFGQGEPESQIRMRIAVPVEPLILYRDAKTKKA
jgi:hypothetical protein